MWIGGAAGERGKLSRAQNLAPASWGGLLCDVVLALTSGSRTRTVAGTLVATGSRIVGDLKSDFWILWTTRVERVLCCCGCDATFEQTEWLA